MNYFQSNVIDKNNNHDGNHFQLLIASSYVNDGGIH